MSTGAAIARTKLFESASNVFKDVITGERARTEQELSALLALYHNWGRIEWDKVHLQRVERAGVTEELSASMIGIRGLTALCEYPLFCAPGTLEMSRQGQFRADVLFLGRSVGPLVYVEAKIDKPIRADLISGALQYLETQNRFSPASFVILRPRENINPKWYIGDLVEVLKNLNMKLEKTTPYVMYWEDVFKSCVDG